MILFGILLLSAFLGTASATTWYVDDDGGADFTNIQDAINNASAGDTIFVNASDGPYYENLIVDYWSDYTGADANGDGLGDTLIPSNSGGNITNDGYWLPLAQTSTNDVIDWWPMFCHDSRRTGYSSSEAPNTNHVLWTYETQGSIASSPAVVNDVVFVGSDDCNIYAINVTTGELIWEYTAGEAPWYSAGHSSPAIAEDKVFIGIGGTPLGVVYALNQRTGELIWSYNAGDGIDSSPVVSDGKVFVNLWNTKVIALDATIGELIWSYDTGGSNRRSSPAVADGKVYTASSDGNFYALDADTGSVIWASSIAGRALSPTIAYGKVFVSCSVCSGNADGIYALNADTGEIIWRHNIGTRIESSPAVAYGKVFVGGEDRVYAFNEATGELLWSFAGDCVPRSCTRDEGLAPRSLLAGAGFKPP
jgi:outer membrane protein assembly factor BamB